MKIKMMIMVFMALFALNGCGANGDGQVSADDALNNVLLIEGDDIPADGGMTNLVVEMTKTKNINEDSFRFLVLKDNGNAKSYRAYSVSDDTTTTVVAPIFFPKNTTNSDKLFAIRIVYIDKEDIRTLGTVTVTQLH
jgi:hypothetical protein